MDKRFKETNTSIESSLVNEISINIEQQLKDIILYGQKYGIEIEGKILENESMMISITIPNDLEMIEQFKFLCRIQVNSNATERFISERKDNNKKVVHFVLKKEALSENIKSFLESFKLFINKNIVLSSICTEYKELVANLMIRNINSLKVKGIMDYKINEGKLGIQIEGLKNREIPLSKVPKVLNNLIENKDISIISSNIGIPLDISKYIRNDEDIKCLANAYGEGRKSLEDLIYFCINNGIKTLASCAGHKVGEKLSSAYLTFILDDKNTMNAIEYMQKQINKENIEIVYENRLGCSNNIRGVTICVDYEKADEIFIQMQQILEEYINNKALSESSINLQKFERVKNFAYMLKVD